MSPTSWANWRYDHVFESPVPVMKVRNGAVPRQATARDHTAPRSAAGPAEPLGAKDSGAEEPGAGGAGRAGVVGGVGGADEVELVESEK
ncbi:hypothetical protein GCM10023167_03250 [Brevibacterium pityocampae]|uniref:Uncharacterized protein n=1 Tax=Brevibacterium pityocampae TaxID=506594 RepID=A0ABP8J1Y8_9MICO